MKILFAGGGTGGHIIPGRNLAEWFSLTWDRCELLFLTTGRRVEDPFFADRNWRVEPLFPGFQSRPSPLNPGPWSRAIFKAGREVKTFNPDLIMLLGGYASLPVMLAKGVRKKPIYGLELNARSGRSAKFFSHFARKMFCQFQTAAEKFGKKGMVTGSPLPPGFGSLEFPSKEELKRSFNLDPDRTTLLAAGGSLGARAVNQVVADHLSLLKRINVQVLHITGETDYQKVKEKYDRIELKAQVHPFLDPMERAYRAADLILCRGGGMTLAEIAALNLPAVIVPYPHHKDMHQLHNAAQIVSAGGGLILEEKEISKASFEDKVLTLLNNPAELAGMSVNLGRTGIKDGSERILSFIKEDLEKNKQ